MIYIINVIWLLRGRECGTTGTAALGGAGAWASGLLNSNASPGIDNGNKTHAPLVPGTISPSAAGYDAVAIVKDGKNIVNEIVSLGPTGSTNAAVTDLSTGLLRLPANNGAFQGTDVTVLVTKDVNGNPSGLTGANLHNSTLPLTNNAGVAQLSSDGLDKIAADARAAGVRQLTVIDPSNIQGLPAAQIDKAQLQQIAEASGMRITVVTDNRVEPSTPGSSVTFSGKSSSGPSR